MTRAGSSTGLGSPRAIPPLVLRIFRRTSLRVKRSTKVSTSQWQVSVPADIHLGNQTARIQSVAAAGSYS